MIIALLLITATFQAQAQNIKGKVCYSKDRTPVQFASVALLQLPDSSIKTGTITLTDGGYVLENITPGNYFIKASFVGYRPSGNKVTVTSAKASIQADTIFLAESIASLSEVSVVAEKLKGKEMVDRTVYNVPEVVSKASANGYDVLKKIPQVNVDFQNNITMNGSSNFIIQVDGRQRDSQFLARLKPTDIQSIEVINNPSGKYEGNIDGVINIILKKEARYGMSGNVGGSLKPFNKVTSGITGSLDYAVGKITFYVTAFNFSQRLNLNTSSTNHFNTIDSTINSNGTGKIKMSMTSVNTGFDYYMNDKNNLSFNINLQPVSQDVNVSSIGTLLKGIIPLNTVNTTTANSTGSNEASASFFYKRTFIKPVEEFTTEISFYNFTSNDGKDFTNSRYIYNDDELLSTYSRNEINLNRRNYLSAKADYVYPLGMYSKIEAGYQFYYQKMAYDFRIDNSETSNLFDYRELRNSMYGGLTFNLKKLGFQAMLRAENSHIMADSVTSPNYTCFLPSANLQYKFSAAHNIKLTYNRRINRPSIYDMNPYVKIGQDYSVTTGNPNLRPDYRDRLQLTYTWNFGSNYFSPYVYEEYFADRIGNRFIVTHSPVNGALTYTNKPFNLLNGYEAGGGVNAMLWYVNINARIYKGHYNEYSEPSFSIPERNYFSYAITSYAFKQLDKKKRTTAVIYLAYNGVNINAQSKTFSMPIYGAGLQEKIKDHNFGVFWLLPFSKDVRFSRTVTETVAFNSTSITGINISKGKQPEDIF